MCSPKKKSRKRAIDSNKRGDYQKFDEFSSQISDPVIESYAKKVIALLLRTMEAASEVVKKLVDMAAEVAPALKITRDENEAHSRPARATATGSFTGNSIPCNRLPNPFHRF
jgi:hypothetical protein